MREVACICVWSTIECAYNPSQELTGPKPHVDRVLKNKTASFRGRGVNDQCVVMKSRITCGTSSRRNI